MTTNESLTENYTAVEGKWSSNKDISNIQGKEQEGGEKPALRIVK